MACKQQRASLYLSLLWEMRSIKEFSPLCLRRRKWEKSFFAFEYFIYFLHAFKARMRSNMKATVFRLYKQRVHESKIMVFAIASKSTKMRDLKLHSQVNSKGDNMNHNFHSLNITWNFAIACQRLKFIAVHENLLGVIKINSFLSFHFNHLPPSSLWMLNSLRSNNSQARSHN